MLTFTKAFHYAVSFCYILVIAVFFQSCEMIQDESLEEKERRLDSIYQKIRETLNTSCTYDSDCRQIALGSKACGGPNAYLVYSVSSCSPDEINLLVNSYNQLENQISGEEDIISDCALVEPHDSLVCDNQVCKGLSYH
ncbi:MAG: hypothetical protein A2Z20_01620 [Bdellovibrionales bacterium RBG_16_40_8]|nr:MAG: hypothetical protein A2Z20_01620 [Bdellovibrionales bacterium RBG_16_40_8]